MMQNDDDRLATWLADGPAHGPAGGLERSLSSARATRQRPAWLVAVTGGTIATERTNRTVGLAWAVVAVVALIGLLIGGLVVGGWLRPQPAPDAVLPSTTAVPSASTIPSPSAVPSPQVAGQGLIAYTAIEALEPGVDCTDSFVSISCFRPRVWISNADGTDAHELFPNLPGRQGVVAWSPDGRQLLFTGDSPEGSGLMLTDASGAEPQPLDAICAGSCSGFDGVVFSPDGSRLAFVRYFDEGSVIATMDLATGAISELESTRTTDPDQGGNDAPRWSPDGTMLVFARQAIVAGPTERQDLLFVVDADGSNLRQLAPTELGAIDPDWSPDGSRIVFISTIWNDVQVDPLVIESDIYTIRPDGSGLQRLTADGASVRPNWTADGRIVFAHLPPGELGETLARSFELWIMDANGANVRQLQADSAAELTAAGCMTCPYPPPLVAEVFLLNDAVWQPTR